jgi:hypothetical protein
MYFLDMVVLELSYWNCRTRTVVLELSYWNCCPENVALEFYAQNLVATIAFNVEARSSYRRRAAARYSGRYKLLEKRYDA